MRPLIGPKELETMLENWIRMHCKNRHEPTAETEIMMEGRMKLGMEVIDRWLEHEPWLAANQIIGHAIDAIFEVDAWFDEEIG